jgi:hypothetical protein
MNGQRLMLVSLVLMALLGAASCGSQELSGASSMALVAEDGDVDYLSATEHTPGADEQAIPAAAHKN